MKKTTYLAIACTLLLLAGGLYYFVKDEPLAPPPPAQEAKSEAAANITFAGSSIVEEKDGKRLFELAAETIQMDPTTKQATMINLKGTIYRENGGKVDLVARQAVFDPQTSNITMDGDIKATSSDGAVFTASQGYWSGKDRRFYGSGGVSLTRDDTVVTGDQLETDEKMEKTKVQGNARVIRGGQPQ